MKFKLLSTSLISSLAVVLFVTPVFAQVITQNDLESNKVDAYFNGKWFMYNDENDTIDNNQGLFVLGPQVAPAGFGSVQFSVMGTERKNIATYRFSGTVLADISELKFSTYNPSNGNGGSVNRSGYLQFNVDFNGSDTWQRRLVYLPSDNGAIIQNQWQQWDSLKNGTALWRYSGTTWPGTVILGSTPRTWNDILASYPLIKMRVTDSFFGVRVGEPYANGYTENIDLIKLSTNTFNYVADFEPLVSPTTKDECKNNGWTNFNNPQFKNQGQCVSFVNHL